MIQLRFSALILLSSFALIAGCTKPGETTGIGAAAGGALGAGLGAIIGSQSGSAGSGLAIGAVAGSASGALIGNAFQAQQEAIRTQDEALERQERMAQAQKAEIDELRRLNSDPEPRRTARPSPRVCSNMRGPGVPSPSRAKAAPAQAFEEAPRAKLREERILPTPLAPERPSFAPQDEELGGLDSQEKDQTTIGEELKTEARSSRSTVPALPDQKRKTPTLGDFEGKEAPRTTSRSTSSPSTPSCSQADEERQLATSASEVSEKLFHLRRALRLCPNSAVSHHELGKVYLSLKRPSDAEYEFKQALIVDPDYKAAARSLEQLKGTANARF